MHSLLLDIDHTLQELRGSVPKWWSDPRVARCGEDETPEEFRRRQATVKAIRVLEEAARELRGEPTSAEATTQAYFAFACGG